MKKKLRSTPQPDRCSVLYFAHTAAWSGAEVVLFNIASRLNRERFEPIVMLGEDGELKRRLEAAGVECHILNISADVVHARKEIMSGSALFRVRSMFRMRVAAKNLAAFIEKRGIDIVHANSLKADILSGFACWGLRGKATPPLLIWHVHDRIVVEYLPGVMVKAFRKACRIFPDAVIANSQATLNTLTLPPHFRSSVIYNGSDTGGEDEPCQAQGLAAPATPPAAPLIGIVGRITHWKGQHIFLTAASMVRERFPAAQFQIIGAALFGEDAYEEELRARVAELRMEECVEFCGFRNDVPQMIERLDVLVHASVTGEPFGQVVVEGMMAGVPVVATNGGGIPEILQEGETGLLVPMNDANSMAEAILRLLEDPRLSSRLAAAGRKHARQNFNIDQIVQRIENTYDEWLAGSRRAILPAAEAAVSERTAGDNG